MEPLGKAGESMKCGRHRGTREAETEGTGTKQSSFKEKQTGLVTGHLGKVG